MKITVLHKLMLFCAVLLIFRIYLTGHFSFLFLLWNLFLAWLPLWFIRRHEKTRSRFGQLFFIGLALLFLPNAPYILTDLFHLTKNLKAPMWFDLILILSFSVLGLAYFILCCERLFAILRVYLTSQIQLRCFKLLVLLSNGYGIYLGRYLRFNSWDVLVNPEELFQRMIISLFDPSHFKETCAVTVTFATFLYLILEVYESSKHRLTRSADEVSQRS